MNFYDILLAKKLGGGGSQPTLIEKTITANGTYNASDDDADGYSKVTVNVPSVEFSDTPTTFLLRKNMKNLSVDIPNGITAIDNSAFYEYIGLVNVTIPNTVTTIGSHAFYKCTGLTNIDIPNSVTIFSGNVFSGCTGLTNIDIPNSVTDIGVNAFSGCTNLATITIHKPEGSISGAPWGAPNTTNVVWTG